jgi:hypothetical protein
MGVSRKVDPGARAILHVAVSSLLGGGFGVAAAVGAGLATFAAFALVFGMIVGLLSGGALAWALAPGGGGGGLATVGGTTAAAAYFGGLIAGPMGGLVVSLAMYLSVCFVFGDWNRRDRAERGDTVEHGSGCAGCGYDLAGNVTGRCPECGRWVDGGGA